MDLLKERNMLRIQGMFLWVLVPAAFRDASALTWAIKLGDFEPKQGLGGSSKPVFSRSPAHTKVSCKVLSGFPAVP